MPLLTSHEARALTFRAAGLLERQAMLQGRDDVATDDATDSRLAALTKTWLSAFSPGDASALERRIDWDGLTLDGLRRIVAAPDVAASIVDAEPWTEWLSAVLAVGPSVASGVIEHGDLPERRLFADAAEPPFLELLTAWVRAGRARVTDGSVHWAAAPSAVRDALEAQLFRDVAGVAELSLLERFRQWPGATAQRRPSGRAPTDVYLAFVLDHLRGGMVAFWQAYPVLARQLATVTHAWVTATCEMLDRAHADVTSLEATFGPLGAISHVRPGLSDPHNGRRRVALVTFASGTVLVYKPRSVGLEAALGTFLTWANNAGLRPQQPCLRIVQRDTYGWCEVAVPARFTASHEVETYYAAAGGLLALCYLLRARDLQMENIVATASGPAIIDAEMLCQPSRDIELDGTGGAPPESCLASGLLTMAHAGPGEAVFDIGGLRGDGVTPTSLGRRRWAHLGTDDLEYSDDRVVTNPTANRVLVNGELQDPSSHRLALLDGFRSTYRFLLAHRAELRQCTGPLDVFTSCATRVLFRPSQHYGSVQYALAAPAYQTSGVLRSCALDTLNRIFNLDTSRPPLWPVVDDERRSLDSLDLPRYWVGVTTTRIESHHGRLDVPYFSRSGLDGVNAVLEAMSDDDLQRQCAILDVALSSGVGTRLRTTLTGRPDHSRHGASWLLAQAEALGVELRAHAHCEPGTMRWRSHDLTAGGWSRHVLYDGSLGAAVFFAGLGAATGQEHHFDQAHAAAADALTLVCTDAASAVAAVGVGACTGVGSLVYGLSTLEALTGDVRYGTAAERLADTLNAAAADGDGVFDVTGGSAGAILGLLSLYRLRGDRRRVLQAQAFGDRLVATQERQTIGAAWPVRRGRPIAGFAHGSAGIALALARLAEASRAGHYAESALAALTHERALFVPALGNWPVVGALDPATSSGYSLMTAWCHGAAGIGLTRALLPRDLRYASWAGDMESAVAATAKAPLGALDQICCGNLGRADILMAVGATLDRDDITKMGVSLVERAAERASRRQCYGLRASGVDYRVFDPGLFRGLAGIGYVLLRAAAPLRLPSLLSFDFTRQHVDSHREVSS